MKKIIMYLEDNVYLNRHTVEILNEQFAKTDYQVEGFHRIDQANNYIEKVLNGNIEEAEICCVITDLNMDDSWLDKKYKSETNGGMFSGWAWLKYNVFDKFPNTHIIIYSGYIEDLKEYLNGNDELEQRKIATVSKGGNDNQGLVGLYKAIKSKLNI